MLQKTAILTFTFLLACAYAQNETYYDEPGYSQNSSETHIVKRGETLYAISKKYGVSVRDIMQTNQLRNSVIKVGQRLNIETYEINNSNRRMASRSQDSNSDLKSGGLKVDGPRTYYKVQRGDNIYAIASQFGVLVDEIREWNGISNIYVGQTLIVGQNDIARIPSYRPAPEEDTREDEAIYRKLSSRTSSRSLNQQPQRRTQSRYDRSENRTSISSYRQRAPQIEDRNNYTERNYDRYENTYDDREVVDYRRNSSDYYRRNESTGNSASSSRYAQSEQIDDSRFFSSNDSRRVNSLYENTNDYQRDYRDTYQDDYNDNYQRDYNDDYESSNKRIVRAADINAGSRAGVLYEYVGEDSYTTEDKYSTPNNNRYESKMNARTVAPAVGTNTSSYSKSADLTGDFTELKSKKATNNRFYAFHNSLPIGSKVKMRIPKNEGYVEVEIIDRLPSYERVMIGLSPACTAILEGAGNPHTVTITAN